MEKKTSDRKLESPWIHRGSTIHSWSAVVFDPWRRQIPSSFCRGNHARVFDHGKVIDQTSLVSVGRNQRLDCSLGSMNWGSSLARITVPGGCTSVPSGCTNLSQSKSVQLAMDGLMEQQLRPFNFESTTGEKRTRNSKMMDRTHSSQDRWTKLLWEKKSSIAVFHGPIHSATKATGLSIAVLRRKD